MNKVLVVIDMQEDFTRGALANPKATELIPEIAKEIQKDEYPLIVFTRDTHTNDYLNTNEGKKLPIKHCIKDTKNWLVCEELMEAVGNKPYAIIDKSIFGYDDWGYIVTKILTSDYYNNPKDIEFVLVGTCTDICVVSNALLLKSVLGRDPDKEVSCIERLCAGTTEENHKCAIQIMRCCQVNII